MRRAERGGWSPEDWQHSQDGGRGTRGGGGGEENRALGWGDGKAGERGQVRVRAELSLVSCSLVTRRSLVGFSRALPGEGGETDFSNVKGGRYW